MKAACLLLSCICFLPFTSALRAQKHYSARVEWNRPVRPFRVIGNIYYVGAAGVSSFLIVEEGGSILLDGGFTETAPQIARNVSTLGFKLKDARYLLNSHAHYDHCGGLAELKCLSGASLVASQGDRRTLESGHQLSFGHGQTASFFPPVHVDRTIQDGEVLQAGPLRITAHITPGHTQGCTTWTMPVTENGRTYQVVFHCSTTVAGNDLVNNPKYPGIVADYERSFAILDKLPCDVLLGPHPEFFNMQEKHAIQLRSGKSDAFVDPQELRRFNAQSKLDFEHELQRQQRDTKGKR